MSLTWDEWIYPKLLPMWGLSDQMIAEPYFEQKNESLYVWACLGVKENTPTTQPALSPHLHVIMCTSFISSMDMIECTVFIYYNVT